MTARYSSLRAMVIDDDEIIVEIAKHLLSELGVGNIETATDGNQALQRLSDSAEPPDIILCDLNMPKMDGVQFIRHLGERRISSGLILISGEDLGILRTVEAMARSHELYILGIIPKPFGIEPLGRLLAEYDRVRVQENPGIVPIGFDELQQGLRNDALSLVYQPRVSMATGKVHGVEALARWSHPVRGLLGPAAFIPLAEEAGLIDALTTEVLRKALVQGGIWCAAGLDLSIAVNISIESLNRLDFPERVVSQALEAGMPLSGIVLEITESQVMKNLKSSLETIARLRLKGIGLAIDDFGTGYSSLEQLKRVPFTELKIDRAFVFGAANDKATQSILESSAGLGKKLNLTVVAEGAETRQDADLAGSAGCDLVQGYFVARPLPANQIPGWVREWETVAFKSE